MFVKNAQLVKLFNLGEIYFYYKDRFFIYLKLEIALAIPASNE